MHKGKLLNELAKMTSNYIRCRVGNMSGDREYRDTTEVTGRENASKLRPGALRQLSVSGRAPTESGIPLEPIRQRQRGSRHKVGRLAALF